MSQPAVGLSGCLRDVSSSVDGRLCALGKWVSLASAP